MPEPAPWPDWLAGLTPEQRVREIINEHAHWCHSAGDRCSGAGAGDLLLRLLDEARAEVAPALAVTPELRGRIDAALQGSIDSCARCKACDVQVDAVMAVIRESRNETPLTSLPPGPVTELLEDAWTLIRNLTGRGNPALESAAETWWLRFSAAREAASGEPEDREMCPETHPAYKTPCTWLAQHGEKHRDASGAEWLAPLGEPEPAFTLAPGGYFATILFFGRIEHTGYVTEVTGHGSVAAYHVDLPDKVWGGNPLAQVEYAASAYFGRLLLSEESVRSAWEADLVRRERLKQEREEWRRRADERALVAAGPAGDEDDDPNDYTAHATGCNGGLCEGECMDGEVPF